ncbi:hypothetical protein TIFTF001_037005 [Ficus carica]|uniref:Uncharacterized protein n=1 Tax=Ficus carica TaxID=3494 RepID=A0AA88E4G5_FICCA|nr:hypothetical protein TIFTF001_037005 [Ficus carica]
MLLISNFAQTACTPYHRDVGGNASRGHHGQGHRTGVEVVALCNWEEKRCSICASNVLISSDIILLIISSTFIIPCGMGPAVGAGVACGKPPVFVPWRSWDVDGRQPPVFTPWGCWDVAGFQPPALAPVEYPKYG